MYRFGTFGVLVISTLLLVSAGFAQQAPLTTVPNLIRYGGTLQTAQGAPLASSTVGITFAIYRQQDGGAPVWMETQNVTTDASGNYSVLLGSTTATGLPSDLFSQQEQRWLGVQGQGQAEQPRVLLVSVPYAFKAHEAETLGGMSASDFVLANGANYAANGSIASPSSSSIPNHNPASQQTTTGAVNDGPTNFSGSTTDQIVGVTQSGTGRGVNASASSGALVGKATATSGTAYGVVGEAPGAGGNGVFGTATSAIGATVGVKGASSSTSGTGVHGEASAATGTTIGVSGYVASSAGIAAVFNNAAGGKILSGTKNGVEQFSVDGLGNVNSVAGSYQLGGNTVLSVTHNNLFLGVGAGSHTTGGGNTFCGYQAGTSNITGSANTFSGDQAGYDNTVGNNNVLYGFQAGFSNTSGADNTFNGYQAGYSNTTSSYNSFYGYKAGYRNSTGEKNTFSGHYAGYNNTTGSDNVFYGEDAGLQNTTGSSDVYIANQGPSSGTESNTIRIGTQGHGVGQQNAAYIAGIYGSTSSSGVAVYINADGLLGTLTSSLRFKELVRDMGTSSSALMKLRPVTFFYKPEYSKDNRTLQYGLIAEEVAQVYPELIAYDNDGKPYSVRYQYLSTMLLNEVQKQYHRAEAEANVIQTQQQQIEAQEARIGALEQRLSRLESLIASPVKAAEMHTPSASAPGEAQ